MKRNLSRSMMTLAIVASSTMLEGCKLPMAALPPTETPIIIWNMSWRLEAGEVEAFISDYPRFLRIRLNPEADLLLDERFKSNNDADYMSVLPTGYGAGTPMMVGEYPLLCGRTLYYACGLKFSQAGRTYVLVFNTRPKYASAVKRLKDDALVFIRERSSPNA